jgi:hypothetical protein
MSINHIIFFCWCLCPLAIFSQTKYSNAFLDIGVGARSLAMGKSTVAQVDDVTAGYWNPAGLATMKKNFDVGLMHSEYFAGIAKYDYMGVAYKLDNSSGIAFSAIRMGVDDIQNTLDVFDSDNNIVYDRITYFSVVDYAFLISYAKQTSEFFPGLQYGANVKVIRRIIGQFASSWGFGIDVGLQYTKGKWKFGAVGKDITSTFNVWDFNEDELKDVFEVTGNEMPQEPLELTIPRLTLGASRAVMLNQNFTLIPEINATFLFGGKTNELIASDIANISPHGGLELGYCDLVFVRGGIGNFQKIKNFYGSYYQPQPGLGVGLNLFGFRIDYAITDMGDKSLTPYSHVISLQYQFEAR